MHALRRWRAQTSRSFVTFLLEALVTPFEITAERPAHAQHTLLRSLYVARAGVVFECAIPLLDRALNVDGSADAMQTLALLVRFFAFGAMGSTWPEDSFEVYVRCLKCAQVEGRRALSSAAAECVSPALMSSLTAEQQLALLRCLTELVATLGGQDTLSTRLREGLQALGAQGLTAALVGELLEELMQPLQSDGKRYELPAKLLFVCLFVLVCFLLALSDMCRSAKKRRKTSAKESSAAAHNVSVLCTAMEWINSVAVSDDALIAQYFEVSDSLAG